MSYWDNKEAEYLEQQRKLEQENFCPCCCCSGSCMDEETGSDFGN